MYLFSRKVARLLQPVALSLCFFMSQPSGADAGLLSLRADEPLGGLSVGDSFAILLFFDDEAGPGLSGFATNLSFDDSIIDYTGTRFNMNFAVTGQGTENSGGFEVQNITGASAFPLFGELITGSDASVAQFFFDVIGTGATSVDFSPTLSSFGELYAGFAAPPTPVNLFGPSSFAVGGPAAPIPLPASALLLGAALAGFAGAKRLRSRHI